MHKKVMIDQTKQEQKEETAIKFNNHFLTYLQNQIKSNKSFNLF